MQDHSHHLLDRTKCKTMSTMNWARSTIRTPQAWCNSRQKLVTSTRWACLSASDWIKSCSNAQILNNSTLSTLRNNVTRTNLHAQKAQHCKQKNPALSSIEASANKQWDHLKVSSAGNASCIKQRVNKTSQNAHRNKPVDVGSQQWELSVFSWSSRSRSVLFMNSSCHRVL